MFYFNYVNKCNEINKSPSAVAEEMGLKCSVVTTWKKGRKPHQATLQKVASYFGCSVEDLLAEKETPATTTGGRLTDAQRELMNLIPGMTEAEVAVLLETAKAQAAARTIRGDR